MNERASNAIGTYFILEGTLDECIQKLMTKPASQHHLYAIHTAPQGKLVAAILSPQQVAELVRLRDFL
jgi:hypothetical protein